MYHIFCDVRVSCFIHGATVSTGTQSCVLSCRSCIVLTDCNLLWQITDHPRSSVVCKSVVPVCMYVCQTITFESLDLGSLYLHIQYISGQYGSSSYMKVIGSRSCKKITGAKSIFPQCKTSIGNNSDSIKP